jgi:hypothetical protein
MKWTLTLLCVTFFSGAFNAQVINAEIFRKNIDVLYTSAAAGFKTIKGEASGTTDDGLARFHSTRKVSGADDVYITMDDEKSLTYIAHFKSKDLATAKASIEDMANMIQEQVAEKGFHRSSGTELGYEGYRKQTVEYESDNIDDLGHHPSFSLGILRGSNPPIIELMINEPLWK